ncbi:3-hydroxylacyl-ACP dehydratase [Collimonas sp. H4R21]|jgi:predicted hotdog family 3-hydroxylacyl-ACP dehydratase|uniref:3-hydroxylacyl-ACP dehydratase n=1 Tax=Collimonas rhizosphaerae TaxID=3126357 RepID=A0ABU9Q058_9BURK|nr:3-hydroxylacyl-ACP dehydratase [Collimonas sp. OK412]SFB74533.1 Predicted 3-hydroxylacyl-ACP dehydratase, HotDog domain [Collimonas sp. OK412]
MMDQPSVMESLDIRRFLPHSGAMVLLDRLLEAGTEELLAEVTIRQDSLFCDGQGVPAWVGVEYMAQAIAAYAGYAAQLRGEAVKIGFLLGTRRYEAGCPGFAVGSVLQVHVQRLLQADNGIGSFECRIHAAGQQLASATITVFQPADAAVFLEGSTE